jgi:flagellar biosynthesis/type III secretory pathway chaperone
VAEPLFNQAIELHQLLTMEFEALKSQDLDLFESLQPGKAELIDHLGQSCPKPEVLKSDPAWQDLREELVKCRDLHRRNAIFIERKLDTIRGALYSLRSGDSGSPVEVYDRLGQVARFNRARAFKEV